MKNICRSSVKAAFTLIELSVVLIVLSILIGSILVSRKIIDRSRGQSLIIEIEQLKKGISVFKDTYGYLPGDVPKIEIDNNFPDLAPLFGTSTGASYLVNTSIIGATGSGHVTMAASCYGMRMLEIAGFIRGVPNANEGGTTTCYYHDANPSGDFGNLTKKAKFSDDVGVFFANGTLYGTSGSRYVLSNYGSDLYSGYAANGIVPLSGIFQELRSGSATTPTAANTAGGSLGESSDGIYYTTLISVVNVRNLMSGAVSSSVAKYADSKMDDGKPLSGKFVAGAYPTSDKFITQQAPSGAQTASSRSSAAYCHSIISNGTNSIAAGTLTGSIMSAATYQTTAPDSLPQGCNIFYRIDNV